MFQIQFKPGEKVDLGSGTISEIGWDKLRPFLEQAFFLKENENLIGITITESGIKARFETINKRSPSMRIDAPRGTSVKGIFESGQLCNGLDWQQKEAMKHIEPGKIYTIDRTIIHSYHTDVVLQEFPGVSFNSVHFMEI